MSDSEPASEASGVGGAPWPVLPQSPGPTEEVESGDGGGAGREAVIRVVVLVALLGIVTAAGIAVGRAVEPSHHTAAATASTTTGTTAAIPAPPPPRPAIKVTFEWGPLTVQRYGKLPAGPPNAAAAVVGPTLAVVGGTGTGLVLAGPVGGKLVPVARLTRPRASAQAFELGGNLYVLGGEQGGKPSDDVLRIDPGTGRGRTVSRFEEPLAEAGVVPAGKAVYLVGGWTGEKYATAILEFSPPSTVSLVTRLPEGIRAPAVARLGHTLYVAGGRTESGPSDRVYAVDLGSGVVTPLAKLPRPVQGALLVSSGTGLYLLGGTGPGGKPSTAVVRIDPATGKPTPAGRMPKALVGAAAVPDGARTLVVDPSSGAVYQIE
jgi:hypothetical protein